jgi:hypothetical protein
MRTRDCSFQAEAVEPQPERQQVGIMAKPQQAQPANASRPTLGLTALRQLAQHITTIAQSLHASPRPTTDFPLPRSKETVTKKGETRSTSHQAPLQKTRRETEITLAPGTIVQPEMPTRFTVQMPGPHMPLLGHNGRITLCRLGK